MKYINIDKVLIDYFNDLRYIENKTTENILTKLLTPNDNVGLVIRGRLFGDF